MRALAQHNRLNGLEQTPLPNRLLPSKPTFTGHQTFALRTGWLKKGIDALHLVGPDVFGRDDALVTLGVGKNMVQSIRHWLIATRMATENHQPSGRSMQATSLGAALFGCEASPGGQKNSGWDPFLEDDATLWLLHWQLAGPGSMAYSWIWTFSHFRSADFTKAMLLESLEISADVRLPKPPSRETMTRDLECLLHTYVVAAESTSVLDTIDCPLNTLGLIRPSVNQHYRFNTGPKPMLPPEIFLYAMIQFWQWRGSDRTLTTHDLTYAEGSPGRIFKLDADSILYYLDDLDSISSGAFRFDDAALTPQVIQNTAAASLDHLAMELLEGYYS